MCDAKPGRLYGRAYPHSPDPSCRCNCIRRALLKARISGCSVSDVRGLWWAGEGQGHGRQGSGAAEGG